MFSLPSEAEAEKRRLEREERENALRNTAEASEGKDAATL